MTNIYGINDMVDFLSRHNITAEQFMYCLLLHNDKKYSRIPGTNRISRPLSQLYKYHSKVRKFTREEMEDLIQKGFIIKNGPKLAPDMLEVSEKFEKEYLGIKFKFDQLLEVYPTWVTNFDHPGKPKINLKVIREYDTVCGTYNRFVKTDKMHNRVLEITQWASETNNINLSIEKYVSSKYWEALIELKSSKDSMENYEVI